MVNAWNRALDLAERTPEARNRYVDLLRALSITAVVFGHWLMAAPWVEAGQLRLEHMLGVAPWTQWLTWGLQVMPVFFIVGGYSNSASWGAALRNGQPYGVWVGTRLRRLVGPIIPLLLFWAVLAMIAHRAGVSPQLIKYGSQAALIPIWFLAVYVFVVVLVPITYRAWNRFGIISFWALVVCAVLVDVGRFAGGLSTASWVNYLFIWLAVHQMGYMWRDGKLGGASKSLPWMFGGLIAMLALVKFAGYPISMVSVPDEAVSNTRPPSLAMLALAMFHGGLVLSLEGPARRLLHRTRVWAATILVNGTIMSVYLWHMTALILLTGLLNLLGGFGLHLEPGTRQWWITRPVWMAVLAVVLSLLLAVFGRFERLSEPKEPTELSMWRVALGSVLVCGALAAIAAGGVGGGADPGPLGIRIGFVLSALVGAGLVGVGPQFGRR
jgi:hypothetical protein